MPNSKILILIICSNNKKKDGFSEYARERSITSVLPESQANALKEGRARILHLIKKGGFTRDGKPIAEHPRNKTLVEGIEFGGDASLKALYLPAAERYDGSFYAPLKPEGAELLINSEHHFLILSGLYGLLTPSEPTQNYSCHVDDHPIIRKFWTANSRLTDIFVAYVRRFGITHIFDLTALKSYRHLIDWVKVRENTKAVFHCFGEQTVGDGLLTPLGYLTRNFLAKGTDEDLLSVKANTYFDVPTDRLYFHSSDRPPSDLPSELEKQVIEANNADETVRMARCIRAILHKILGDFEDKGIPDHIRRSRAPEDVKRCMSRITGWRNKVEHTYGYSIQSIPIDLLRESFAVIKRWVQDEKTGVPSECVEV